MPLSNETKTTLHVLVLLAVASPITKAMVAIIAGAYFDVGISLALFIIFGTLYWFFGIDYFEAHHWFGLEEKEKLTQSNVPKIVLHTIVLLIIIISLLLSVTMLTTEEYVKMGLLLALFIVLGALYWIYGIDFFETHHLLGKEKKT